MTMDQLFLEVDEEMKPQFFACFNYFLKKKQITSVDFQTKEDFYIHEFSALWNDHLMLMRSDDECYGRLITGDKT